MGLAIDDSGRVFVATLELGLRDARTKNWPKQTNGDVTWEVVVAFICKSNDWSGTKKWLQAQARIRREDQIEASGITLVHFWSTRDLTTHVKQVGGPLN
jgi:hypothetical protein